MELRRSRKLLVLCAIFGLGGVVVVATAGDRISGFRLVLGSIGILVAAALLVRELRPFRFRILPEGLDVRHRGLDRTIPWAEIDAIVLDQAYPGQEHTLRLLVVPAPGSELAARADAKHPADGRPAVVLLETKDVQDDPDAIAQAVTTVAGGRFADLRGLAEQATDAPPADFTMVLRGYAPHQVDRLIRAANAAIDGDPDQRATVRAQLADPPFEVVLRGYDRGQVDAHLQRLATTLAGQA